MAMPRTIKTEEIQEATTIKATETVVGSAIDTRNYNTMIIYIDYTNGDETSWELIPKFLRVAGGDEHQLSQWSSDAEATLTQQSFKLTATAKTYVTLDIRGVNQVKLYQDSTGGTPDGTVQIGYTLISE